MWLLTDLIKSLNKIADKKILVVKFGVAKAEPKDRRRTTMFLSDIEEITVEKDERASNKIEKRYKEWSQEKVEEPRRKFKPKVLFEYLHYQIPVPEDPKVQFKILQNFLPTLQGLNTRNIEHMRVFYRYPIINLVFHFRLGIISGRLTYIKPFVDPKKDRIVLDYGQDYIGMDLHKQHFEIIDIKPLENSIYILIEEDIYDYPFGWRSIKFLISIELTENNVIQKSVRQVFSTLRSVDEALDYITPKEARKKNTVRQGDLFFVPVRTLPKNIKPHDKIDPNNSHRIQNGLLLINKKKRVYIVIDGEEAIVTHKQHGTVVLKASVSRFWKVLVAKTASRSSSHYD